MRAKADPRIMKGRIRALPPESARPRAQPCRQGGGRQEFSNRHPAADVAVPETGTLRPRSPRFAIRGGVKMRQQ
jgi:hypothetical protein